MSSLTRTTRTLLISTALAAAVAVSLSGCVIPPFLTGQDRTREPVPESTLDPSAPPAVAVDNPEYSEGELPPLGVAPVLETDPPLMIMTDELFARVNTVQGLTWAKSTPDGTWSVGKGFPVEFPAGLPLFPDRWVKGYPLIVESDDLLMLSYTFWGGYDDVDAIMTELAALGFETESQILPERQAHIAENDQFRLVITVAEGVTDIQEPSRVYDPQYTYNVKFLGVPYPGS